MTLTRKKEMPRGTKRLTAKTGLKQMSDRRRAELVAAGSWSPFSTLAAASTVGLSRVTPLKAGPKVDKPPVEKIPLPRAPWRGEPEPKTAVPKPVKRPKDTGPTVATRRKVKARDKRCVRCGCEVLHGTSGVDYSIQHILGRGSGGTLDPQVNDVDWLILVCGNGASGCHGEIEGKYRARAYGDGHARKRTAIYRHLHTLLWHGRRCRLQDGKVFDARTGREVAA